MVRPSKSMQPEHVDLEQASRRTGSGAAFGEDSFRNYMAVKIAAQRKQFGLVLPPPPPAPPPPASLSLSSCTTRTDAKPTAWSKQLSGRNRDHGAKRQTEKKPFGSRTTRPTPTPTPVGTEGRAPLFFTHQKSIESATRRPSIANGASNASGKHCTGTGILYKKRPTLLERRRSLPVSSQTISSNACDHRVQIQMQMQMQMQMQTKHRDRDRDPDGTASDRSVRFVEQEAVHPSGTDGAKTKETKRKRSHMESMIHRLKRRHGRGNRRLQHKTKREREPITYHSVPMESGTAKSKGEPGRESEQPTEQEDSLTELARIFSTVDNNDDDDDDDDDPTASVPGDSTPKPDRELCRAQEIDTKPPTAVLVGDRQSTLTFTTENGLAELARMFCLAEEQHDDDDPRAPLDRDGSHGCSSRPADDAGDAFPRQHTTQTDTGDTTAPLGWESPDDDDDDDESSTDSTLELAATSLSPNTLRRSRPDLFFYGVVVKVAGYTDPDNETIKRLLQKHGGDFETYETERVTHIIAQQLSMAKANVYKKARRPRPVCRPAWILDSIREGKLLPHGNYLLIEEKDQKQMGIQTLFQKQTVSKRQQENSITHSSTSSSLPKAASKCSNPYVSQKKRPLNSDCDPIGHPNDPPEKGPSIPSASANATLRSPIIKEKPKDVENPENDSEVPKNPKKTATTDKQYINGKVRTIGTDPNFLDSYFENSRLSFIGSFKQRTTSTNHSNKNNVSSPRATKLIFHVDMDCFFAAVVLRNFPQYKNKPVVISHHGKRSTDEHKNDLNHIPKNSYSECATCNYEARKYGIKKGMFLGRAKELCQELIVMDYDFQGYEEVSQQVLEILDRVASSENYCGIVEMVSCDEAYMQLNFDAEQGMDSVHDRASQLAESIRNEIFDTTQCTASIGVGANKFLAKLGTDKAKPNNSYCVRDHRELLKSLKLRDMHGVGWRTENKLTEEGLVSVQDVWDLGPRAETELIRILGPGTGKKIFRFTEGHDDRPMTAVERKTIGAECNYGVRFDGPYGIDHFMEGLAKEVEKRMVGIDMKGKRLTLKIKQRKKDASNRHKFLGHGSCHNLSKSATIPGGTALRDSKVFKRIGLELFKEFGIEDVNEIRGMGMTISNLEHDDDTSNEGPAQGMKSWLQKNMDSITLEGKKRKEKAETSNPSMDEGMPASKHVVQSRHNPNMASEKDGKEQEDHRTQESPLLIDLPPMSQIKMTQVEALPPEYQQHIISRMKKARRENGKEGDVTGNNNTERLDKRTKDREPETDEEIIVLDDSVQWTPQPKLKSGRDTLLEDENLRDFQSPLMIELPPMSQIQMSQVEALPSDLRQQVISRMQGTIPGTSAVLDKAPEVRHAFANQQIDGNGQQHSAARFRQTDLKRMMKLAAVKSGHENAGISLTQLEQLPLEIKLQVVNHDDRKVGILSQHPSRSAASNDRRPRKSTSTSTDGTNGLRPKAKVASENRRKIEKGTKKQSYTNKARNISTKKRDARGAKTETTRRMRIVDRVDSWKDDVLPLKQFLDENCPLRDPDSIEKVLEFLSIVFGEGRLTAMVTMIRSIRNRCDAWSTTEILERITETLDRLHMERYGSGLDVEWLMGRADC